MCGRYTITGDLVELEKLVRFICKVVDFKPRYNLAPRAIAPVLIADAVDKWVKTHNLIQNPSQPGMVELSTEHLQFYTEQIDWLRPTIYDGAAAIIFRYQDRTSGQVQVVIIKLDRPDHAVPLARAIAWRRIQLFPYGQFVQGTDADLMDCPPFNPGQCVDHYFRKRWHTAAKARLSAQQAAIAKLLQEAEDKLAEQAARIAGLESQSIFAESGRTAAVAGHQREYDRAESLMRLVRWLGGIIIIIVIIIIFGVYWLWPQH